ncbi:hypothetical protein CHELA1G11_14079 [Hyphomicrobiales bacterium]|nr:hypothetical protein CHELA1G2_10235 [Hyphomicrobiales bacterium]CAH1676075.1 hypothetical protein CHELA1G11_14079 [Hyphomicrobiales bacterium]
MGEVRGALCNKHSLAFLLPGGEKDRMRARPTRNKTGLAIPLADTIVQSGQVALLRWPRSEHDNHRHPVSC